jgi:uncharacterized membrane protein YbhN (UPF0104 family)
MNAAVNRRRSRWIRGSLSLSISGGLLAVLLGRLDPDALLRALAALNIPVMGVGFLMFGLFLLLGSLRWRIALRASGLSVPFPVLLRASLVGHLFNMAFFGPVGGDLAKSAAYARWHDYKLHDLLATAVVDRSFAAAGAVLLGLSTLAVFMAATVLPSVDLSRNAAGADRLVLIALLVALVIAILILRLRRRPFFQQLLESFAEITRQLRQAPGKVLVGCALGFAGQVLVSYILLVSLIAITYPEVRCMAFLWAFPLIAAISGLPVSIAGAGLREGMAVLLLGSCVAAPEPVVVAGLLVFGIYVLWGIIGVPVFLWEEHRHARNR